MTAAVDGSPVSAVAGWLRFLFRLSAVVPWLIICALLDRLFRLWSRATPWPRRCMAGINWLAGFRITAEGRRANARELILANHVSWIDIPALCGVTGTAFVAHDGLAAIPGLRWLCERNDTVFVARHDRSSVASQVDQVRTAIEDTGALTIFPEGTTSDGTGLLPFKSSLLSAIEPVPSDVAVQPVLLDYGPEAAQLAWIGDDRGAANFVRILSRSKPIEITLCFLPPLQGEELTNRKTMAAAAHRAIGLELARRQSLMISG